jgi:putative ABC transport system ATP-binding protein
MIRFHQVTRRYLQGGSPVLALDRLNLEIAEHEFLAVKGESGSGKSTLLHLLGGLDQPDEGEIWVGDIHLNRATESQLVDYRRRQVGIVFQFFNLLPTLNVLENVSLPLQLQGQSTSASETRGREMLSLVGLTDRADHLVHQLSGGEMQRAAIARALIHRPRLVLADEPTGNLDCDNAGRIVRLLRQIADRRLTTIVLITHSPEVAAAADRVVTLRAGRLAAPATTEEERSQQRNDRNEKSVGASTWASTPGN